MLKAWLMMAAIGDTQRPTRCMNVYAKYRNEISSAMHDAQSGKNNSQYGKHWYTNRDTGENNIFLCAPNEKWILGRNLFQGENCRIPISKTEIIEKIRKGVVNFYKNNNSLKKVNIIKRKN